MNFPGRIPIVISPYFWLLAGFIGLINTNEVVGTLVWIGVIVVSVLVHEYGHALTARLFGQQARIELVAFGGLTYRQGPKLPLWKEFIVVMNGPCFGLILFALSFQLSRMMGPGSTLWHFAIQISVAINLFWSVLNLLPVVPLDGGKLMSILLEGMLGVRGIKISLFISMLLAIAIGIFFFLINAFIVGALFFFMAFEGYRNWTATQLLTDQDQDESIQKLFEKAEKYYHSGQKEEALVILQEVREKGGKGLLYAQATLLLASILSTQSKFQEAYDLLLPLQTSLEGEELQLMHQLAYSTGHWENAIEIGNRSFQISPRYDTALINALSCALLGQVQPTMGWLQCAAREGLQDLNVVVTRPEFDKVRSDSDFQRFVAHLNE